MAKILVADDNSNVQKTVTLALADLGIEVLAVNNGDAAVRKLADFSPDLVLADIFMPVRNGYEVCEYVKKDSRFASVPVVLLVGAFDPLDEREAQRVGADGILKKPFVPPDPLITMVKLLLERSLGERLAEMPALKAASVPAAVGRANSGGSIATEDHPSIAVAHDEPPVPEFPAAPGRVQFGDGEHPVAFSQLLETPARDAVAPDTGLLEPVDNEQILTSSRDATLGDPIFWRNDDPEPEPNVEDIDETTPDIGVRSWKQEDDTSSRREGVPLLQAIEPVVKSIEDPIELLQPTEPVGKALEPAIDLIQPEEPLELIREGDDEAASTIVNSAAVVLDPAEQTPLTVKAGKAEELAANPLEWMATAPKEPVLELAPEPSQDRLPETSPESSLEISEDRSAVTLESHEPASAAAPADKADALKTSLAHALASALSPASVSVPVLTPDPKVIAVPVSSAVTTTADPTKTQPSMRPVASSTEDTAHSIPKQDWADLTAGLQPRATELVQKKLIRQAVTPGTGAPVSVAGTTSENLQPAAGKLGPGPDPALVEQVVQRVLDKMRPQVVDIITKEFLRPIVQALVTREIDKH